MLLGAEQYLQTYIGDPAGLTVVGGDGLKASAAHQEKIHGMALIERLTTAQTKRGLPLLGNPSCELAGAMADWKSVCLLLVI